MGGDAVMVIDAAPRFAFLNEDTMTTASNYWQLVRLNNAGDRKVEAIASARSFFNQCFSNHAEISDTQIQQALLLYLEDGSCAEAADLCLRCYISHLIEQTCVQLERQFGLQHGFTRYDLFLLLLNDDGMPRSRQRQKGQWRSLASEILQSFDPQQASLNTWVARQVRHHRELSAFLLEHGVYLITDWAILNDTQVVQLKRILSDFYLLTSFEIEQSCELLQAYHSVYVKDRIQQRLTGSIKGKQECVSPTPHQLARIAQLLSKQSLSTNQHLLTQLHLLASRLRQYRIHVRGGRALMSSLDDSQTKQAITQIELIDSTYESNEQNHFLHFYREQLQLCLDEIIRQVTCDRLNYLRHRRPQLADQFLQSMYLFHCQGQSMGEIAVELGLAAQYQVTRLMKLKEFRADVQQRLLCVLSDRVIYKTEELIVSGYLHKVNQSQIEAALEEEISSIMQQAEAEAATSAKQSPRSSLFACRLCQYLDTLSMSVHYG